MDTPQRMFVDSRAGSRDYANAFVPWGIATELTELPFADFTFTGNGPDGEVSIGIELKRLADILACIRDGRFSGHQLPGLLETYHRVVLIIEGVWRPGQDGTLEELMGREWKPARGRFLYRELTAFLTTMTEICGVRVDRTANRYETTVAIAGLFKWWQKPFHEHTAHRGIHQPPLTVSRNGRSVRILRPTLLRRVVSQLENVAGEKSAHIAGDEERQIAGRFDSVYEMALAEPCDWRDIPGIGRKSSQDIVRALRNLPKDAVVEPEPVKRRGKGAKKEEKTGEQ